MEARPHTPGSLLATIDSPADVRALPVERLPELCDDLRDYIVDIVSVHGGHFGASLGVVELTVALHWAFETPEDQLVWDVGHQAYGHKILTGRRDAFHTNRKYGGLSGFPKRSESVYDTFGVGHASTSISAALGMAAARDIAGTGRRVAAVIGDGSMTGGLAFEGLNNAGVANTDLLVVLNDNRISIDPNVGALHEYLAKVSASGSWNALKGEVWDLFEKMRGLGGGTLQRLVAKLEDGVKAVLTPGMLFEALGFRYIGPVDGHDVVELAKHLQKLRALPGPILLHTLTVKGKGFAPAEADQVTWHAQSSPFDKLTGDRVGAAPVAVGPKKPLWQAVFGDAIIELAEQDPRVVGITAAMPSGTSLNKMMAAMPDRAFDVGIAEMHAVVFAAGLATQGMRPFCAIYSTFLQRAYDGVVHDVALQNLPVVFCMDRAGVAGADGPTHHGALDVPYMRCVPGLVVAAPLDEQDLRDLMYTSLQHDGPVAIRYPRGEATGMALRPGFEAIPIGTGRRIADGTDAAIVSYGAIGGYVDEARERLAADGLSVAHYDLRFVKPLDEALLAEVFERFDRVVTLEDGVRDGGAGSAVVEWASDRGVLGQTRVTRLGMPDHYVEHGSQRQLHDEMGIGPDGIVAAVRALAGADLQVAGDAEPA